MTAMVAVECGRISPATLDGWDRVVIRIADRAVCCDIGDLHDLVSELIGRKDWTLDKRVYGYAILLNEFV